MRARKTFSILFYVKRSKLLLNAEAPIFMRISVNGQRAECRILRSIKPELWNNSRGCAYPKNEQARDVNTYLEQAREKIYQLRQDVEHRNQEVTAELLKDLYLGRNLEEPKTLIEVYREHNERVKLMVGKGFTEGTMQRHEVSMRHLQDFLQQKYKKNDIFLKDIDKAFINNYETYLRVTRNCCNNTTVKYIKNFQKIIKMALEYEWIKSNPFRGIRYKLEEVDKPFLIKDELEKVMKKEFSIKRLEHVRDVFLFCCFTGLAFVDVYSLTEKDLEVDNSGNVWIKKQRHKTRQWAHIPLLPPARRLLEKYRLDPICLKNQTLLPVYSNQRMNAYLKELADLCGIKKNLTTHCARYTFATTVTLANNISMESVSKMLGHASINMTKKYARILDSTISKEMGNLTNKFDLN